MHPVLASRLSKVALLSSLTSAILLCATPAQATALSNAEMVRAELGFSYIRGEAQYGVGTHVPYGGGIGGIRFGLATFYQSWIGLEVDFRLAVAWAVSPRVDLGVDAGVLFAPARWHGRYPGSFVLGTGMGAGMGWDDRYGSAWVIELSWDPPGRIASSLPLASTISIQGDCIQSYHRDLISDTGSATIEPSEKLQTRSGANGRGEYGENNANYWNGNAASVVGASVPIFCRRLR